MARLSQPSTSRAVFLGSDPPFDLTPSPAPRNGADPSLDVDLVNSRRRRGLARPERSRRRATGRALSSLSRPQGARSGRAQECCCAGVSTFRRSASHGPIDRRPDRAPPSVASGAAADRRPPPGGRQRGSSPQFRATGRLRGCAAACRRPCLGTRYPRNPLDFGPAFVARRRLSLDLKAVRAVAARRPFAESNRGVFEGF